MFFLLSEFKIVVLNFNQTISASMKVLLKFSKKFQFIFKVSSL